MAHHHLGLAYADYFATTVVPPEVDDAGADHSIYGVHQQPGVLEAAFVPAEMSPHGSKQAALVGHFVDFAAEHAHHRQQPAGAGHYLHATLTSLSLHGQAAEARSSQHHQHELLRGAHRQQHHQAWPQPQQQPGAWHLLRGSRFLLPTQLLLQEFCGLPAETTAPVASKPPRTNPADEEDGTSGGVSSSASASARIQAMDAAELQRLKAKLYAMLDEVDRRYRRYREQMRAVAGSFEALAGPRAAAPYTRLASRTISRHFRALRDGVAAQVEAVRRALGEKDAGVPRTKGEMATPRLRALDQCLRQRRAYQAGVIESQPWRPQRGLPERAVSILRAWLFEHFLHPYPSDVDKHILVRQTGLSRSQVSNWFINARVRLWKPMVEEMYAEEVKDDDPAAEEGGCSNTNTGNDDHPNAGGEGRRGGNDDGGVERKPTRAQLQVVHDAGSLASVVSIGSSSRDQQHNLNFGLMDHHLDFGSYDDHHGAADGQGFSGVSLTLGLQQQQQHADPYGGVNVAFAAAPSSSAYEFPFMAGGGEHQIDDGGGVFSGGDHGHQFGASVAEGDTGLAASATNYPDRGLQSATGFQLLRDLAG